MAQRRTSRVVSLDDRRGVKDAGSLQTLCANPRCDELFVPGAGPGRRRQYHSPECKKSALKDMRRLQGQLELYRREAGLVEARLAAYAHEPHETPAAGDEIDTIDADADADVEVTAEQWAVAREAVARVGGMARFLTAEAGEFAQDLLDLHTAVEPIIRRTSQSDR